MFLLIFSHFILRNVNQISLFFTETIATCTGKECETEVNNSEFLGDELTPRFKVSSGKYILKDTKHNY